MSPPSPAGGQGPRVAITLHLRLRWSRLASSVGSVAGTPPWPRQLLTKQRALRCHQDGPVLSFEYLFVGLGESRPSFKRSNLFPGSSQGYAGAPPYPFPFLDLLGFQPLSYAILFQNFPRLGSSPRCSAYWLLLCMPQSFVSSSGFYFPCLSSRIPPSCLSFPLEIWVKDLVVPWG